MKKLMTLSNDALRAQGAKNRIVDCITKGESKSSGASKLPVRLALALMALGGVLTLASPAEAKNKVVDTTAALARGCVTTGACNASPTTKAFGMAVQSMDRLGWEIGRTMSIRKHGPAGDPGRYPGIRRR